MQNKDISEVIDLGDIDLIPAGKYRDHMMKTRVGQYFFRMAVLNSYENRCCVTGLKRTELLVASHIKPWKVSDERTERTNPTNGLCLNSLHDKAFDRGLITLDKNYKIIVSRKLKDTDMDSETKSLEKLEKILSDKKIDIRSSNMKRRKDEYITYIFGISMPENIDVSEVVTDISKIHSVKFVDL